LVAPTNYFAATLTGGTWRVVGPGAMALNVPGISTNAATIILDGASAAFTGYPTATDLLASISLNAASGHLAILDGTSVTTDRSFENRGTVIVGADSTFNITGYQAGPPAPPSGTVIDFPFDSDANDAVGTNNPTATAGLTFVPGKVGNGVELGPSGY